MSSQSGIVIVGAGPTGLVAAIELARRGIFPRIVEKKSAPLEQSRALGINARSLALLEPSGVTAQLLAKGRRVGHLALHAEGRRLVSIPLSDIGGRYPFILVLPQDEVEIVLAERLAALGVEVEWSTELVALEREGETARLTLQGPAGAEQVSAGLVVGADGAHSFVRKAAGLSFAGEAYETEWGLADVRVAMDFSFDGVNAFDLAPVLFAVIPIRGDLVRLVCNRPDVLAHVPRGIRIDEVLWESRFRIAHRRVETYRAGNLVLAGDAAHVHSPLGARGMNLGMEDAAWLAWRIAEGRIEAYSSDRLPVARGVLAAVDPATRIMASGGAASRFLRRRVLPLVASVPFLRKRALRQMSGLGSPEPPWL